MNTAYLKSFIEVVHAGSFSKAADSLFITQPAVTKQIKALEQDLGVVLLARNGNKLAVTDEGQTLYSYAMEVLNKEEALYAKFCHDEGAISGTLSIYASSLPGTYLLDGYLKAFSDKYQNIDYSIKKVDSKAVYQAVESGVAGFGFTGIRHKRKGIKSIEVAKDELVLALPASRFKHLKDQMVDAAFLLEQDFIIRRQGSATLKLFEEALAKKGRAIKDLKVKAVVEDGELIKKMILRGMGVSVMSRLSISKEVEEGLIVPVHIKDMPLTRGIYYIYAENRYISGVDEKFKQFILNEHQKLIKK